ncbi:phosphoadenosine phosphosulfate reductase [compost metagenome]
MPRVMTGSNVFDAALERIRWLWDEFDGKVVVSTSGGKDSTIVYHLARIVAEERGAESLPVMWLDQECEFQATADYVRDIMYDPFVKPVWLQIPFDLFNATSSLSQDPWLHVWGPGETWVRDQDPISIKENTFGTVRFKELLHAVSDQLFPDHVILTGVRAEESPSRRAGLTNYATHRWATWGSKGKRHTNMHPIYDWSYRDVWKAILDNGWRYNETYDVQHRHGTPILAMRVSNYHHETSINHLGYLQEAEPETYERATARLSGIATAARLVGDGDWMIPKALPYMFTDWFEYRDYLVEHLLPPEERARWAKKFREVDDALPHLAPASLCRSQIGAILANDRYFTKMDNLLAARRGLGSNGKKFSQAEKEKMRSDRDREREARAR